MTAHLCLLGRVIDASTGAGLAGLAVHAVHAASENQLGTSATDRTGGFRIEVPVRDTGSSLRYRVDLGPDGTTHTTEPIDITEDQLIAIPNDVLKSAFGGGAAVLSVLGDSGPMDELEIGQSLAIAATGLRPSSSHTVELRADPETLAVQVLASDAFGALPATVVLPQFGLTDPSGEPLTIRDAQRRWKGRTIAVEVRASDEVVAARELMVAGSRTPIGFASDRNGRLRNAVDSQDDDVFVTLAALPKSSWVRIFAVPAQGDWVVGDPIEPVSDIEGREITVDVDPEEARRPVMLARAGQLAPGAFDLIARPMRYGFEFDERMVLQARDIVVGRRHTGLVVRERWLLNSPILDAPTNSLQMAGSTIGERPYFRYRDTFAVGEDVWAALDPGIVPPGQIGRKAAFYLIESKTAAQWAASTALTHVPALQPPEVLLQASCINANKTLVWPAANQVGEFDVIADFGNNDPDPAAFVKDGNFDEAIDMIDGYFAPGLRIVRDPGTMTEFANVGAFAIDAAFLTAMGEATSLTVDDENGAYFTPGAFATVSRTFARQALVRFPADIAGATSAAQISAARPDYPLVMIVHGNGHLYTNYAFLLDHLAANGCVAMSIFMPNGIHGLARANAFFHHLNLIRTIFGPKLQNNVGVVGHSRGGEAVFKIARLNQTLALGIGLNGILALGPTDQYGRETINGAASTPLHVLYGAKDADVSGWPPYAGYNVRQSGFSLYDRTDGDDKSMTFVEDATHNGFVTTNEFAPAPLLPEADQRRILVAEANAFFRMTLRGESEWRGMFTGEWRAPGVAASPAKTHMQFRSTDRRALDDFEGVHSATSWQTSGIGGAVVQTGLPADPVEAQLYPHDNQSPHDSAGLRLGWDTATDRLQFDVPAGQRDVTGYSTLSLSVTRVAGSAANPPNDAQNLRAVLRDGAGNERSIRASAFKPIPVEAAANTAGNVKSAMSTIRIPLDAYTIVCAGAQVVDLSDVVSVRLDFTEKPTGEIAVDNVEFSA